MDPTSHTHRVESVQIQETKGSTAFKGEQIQNKTHTDKKTTLQSIIGELKSSITATLQTIRDSFRKEHGDTNRVHTLKMYSKETTIEEKTEKLATAIEDNVKKGYITEWGNRDEKIGLYSVCPDETNYTGPQEKLSESCLMQIGRYFEGDISDVLKKLDKSEDPDVRTFAANTLASVNDLKGRGLMT